MTDKTADAGGAHAVDSHGTDDVDGPHGSGTTADPAEDRSGRQGRESSGGADQRRLLPTPTPLDPRARRLHQVVIGLLMLVTMAIGAYWTFTTVYWSPIDEVAHFGYVESLARGDGIPTVGQDRMSDETMASLKESRSVVMPWRSYPYQPTADDPAWGATASQYEAIHGPTYYALMTPAYWIGQPFGTTGSLYAVRLATALLVALVIPLTWALARRVFPETPTVWLLAPALLATVNSISPGVVGNDSLALVLSIATTIVFLQALNEPRRWLLALAAGALFGLTIVTKSTSLVLVPFLALAFVAWVVVVRPKLMPIARFVVAVGAGAVVTFSPWLAWNLHAYSAVSAAKVVDALTGATLPSSDFGFDAIDGHAQVARPGVWVNQLLLGGSYSLTWEWVLIVALVLGSIAAVVRRRWRDLGVLLWCGTALPLAFLTMEVIVFVLFDGTGGPVGRHLIAALSPTMVMVAGAVVLVVGSRWAPPVVAAIVAFTFVLQVPRTNDFITWIYLASSIDHRLAPVVVQDYASGVRDDATTITFDVDCPVEAIGVGVMDDLGRDLTPVPSSLVVSTPTGDVTATHTTRINQIETFRLERPAEGPLVVVLPPGTPMRVAGGDREPGVSFEPGIDADPVATAYCASSSADEEAFASTYDIGHPNWISLGMVRGAQNVMAAGAVGVALVLTGLAARAELRARRSSSRPDPSPREPTA